MAQVKYVGWDDIEADTFEKKQAETVVDRETEKIQRLVNNELELIVHVKEYSQTGEKHKYSVHIRANYPGGTVVSDKAHDWQLLPAMKQGLKAIEQQLRHRFQN